MANILLSNEQIISRHSVSINCCLQEDSLASSDHYWGLFKNHITHPKGGGVSCGCEKGVRHGEGIRPMCEKKIFY